MKEFKVIDLHVCVGDREILKGLNLRIKGGEVHAIMGPNGSGKSVFSNTVMGDQRYKVTKGDIRFDGESLLPLKVDERARKGIFLAFQYPQEVPGVTISTMLWTALSARSSERRPAAADFQRRLKKEMKNIKLDDSFVNRSVNEGFSGGEKKRAETLQMAILEPGFIILDEPDSGLDVDAMKLVAGAVKKYADSHPNTGMLIITHYQRILRYIRPQKVHVLVHGRIVKSGDYSLAKEVECKGYEGFGNGGGVVEKV
jgi:Fe-S cluster assembly ATP-binding protein